MVVKGMTGIDGPAKRLVSKRKRRIDNGVGTSQNPAQGRSDENLNVVARKYQFATAGGGIHGVERCRKEGNERRVGTLGWQWVFVKKPKVVPPSKRRRCCRRGRMWTMISPRQKFDCQQRHRRAKQFQDASIRHNSCRHPFVIVVVVVVVPVLVSSFLLLGVDDDDGGLEALQHQAFHRMMEFVGECATCIGTMPDQRVSVAIVAVWTEYQRRRHQNSGRAATAIGTILFPMVGAFENKSFRLAREHSGSFR